LQIILSTARLVPIPRRSAASVSRRADRIGVPGSLVSFVYHCFGSPRKAPAIGHPDHLSIAHPKVF
jgi:hypothetical protein